MRLGLSKLAVVVAAMTAIAAAACVDLSSPKDAPASISQIQLGALFVVRGDVMRDTLGNPSKPTIVAYDASGNPTTGFTPTFFVTDSNPRVHFDANGILTAGDSLGVGHIIGQIGPLQTAPLTVYVTVAPTTLARPTPGIDSVIAPVGLDSASSIGTVTLQTIVRGDVGVTVPGVFVHYVIERAPASKSGSSPAVYLQDDANNRFLVRQTSADTTDASGLASRKLVVNTRLLEDASILSGQKIDTVVVIASALYRGAPLANSPLRIAVPLRVSFGK